MQELSSKDRSLEDALARIAQLNAASAPSLETSDQQSFEDITAEKSQLLAAVRSLADRRRELEDTVASLSTELHELTLVCTNS